MVVVETPAETGQVVGEVPLKRTPTPPAWRIVEAVLYECSICTFPAYEATSISARSRQRDEIRARSLAAWKERMKAKLKGE